MESLNVFICICILLVIVLIALIRAESILSVVLCFFALTIIAYFTIYQLKAD